MTARWAACLVLVTVWWCADAAPAAPVRVDFAGTVELVESFPNGGSLPAWFQSLGPPLADGSPFSGFFTFDEAQSSTQVGDYLIVVPPWSLATTVGSLSLVAQQPYQILLLTTPGDEPGNINVFGSLVAGGGISANLQILLKDRFGHPLPSTDLDEVPWDLALYPQSEISWVLQNALFPGEDVRVLGRIQFLSGPPHVAEPSSALMLAAAGLALLGAHVRRAMG